MTTTVRRYLDEYEFRHDDGRSHKLTDDERELLEDFGEGLFAALTAPPPEQHADSFAAEVTKATADHLRKHGTPATKAALAHADDVALLERYAKLLIAEAKALTSTEHKKIMSDLVSAYSAVLDRMAARDAVIEDEATVNRVAEAIEAADLAGKADTAEDIARAAIRALKGA